MIFLSCISSLYSQGRDRSRYQPFLDTGKFAQDTGIVRDSTKIRLPVDSTARVKYFRYSREDRLTALFEKDKSPIIMTSSSRVDYKIEFDSSNNVIIRESILGEEIKYPLKVPLDKYIEVRSKENLQNQFYKIIAETYKIEVEDELQKIFKSITEITIPLPFVSETIFGPPTISLRINGQIDITASYEKNTTEGFNIATSLGQDQSNINFKQDVSVTTKGTVGDKLTIDADWNSQRTFEFENQLKLKYKGYPDEVIQSIEAGNVSLDTRSNLIGSSQALFGVKAQFKLGPLTLTTLASQKKSEKREVNVTGGSQETSFNIPIYDYASNNFLVDVAYQSVFQTYFDQGLTNPTFEIKDIEVWVQTQISNPNKRYAVGYINLTERLVVGYDSTFYTNVQDSAGHISQGYFYKLGESEFTVNKQAGYITVNNLSSNSVDAVAIAYKRGTANPPEQYGDFQSNVNANVPLVLKLVRPRNLQAPTAGSTDTVAWSHLLKNIYQLPVKNIKNDASKLIVDIKRNVPGLPPENTYNGKSYLYYAKLDIRTINQPNDTIPDGLFDFFPGKTVDLLNGLIIFPTLRPFSKTMIQRGVSPDTLRGNDTIYTGSRQDAINSSIKFTIEGKATGDASSRYSLGFNVVEGSVKVFNGSAQLTENTDFTIDYATGELVIINAGALTAGANLKITYESNDLFTLASKTLIGTRAELQINKTSYLGFTLLNLNQKTLNDKIRVGEEPTNNTIIGFDGSTDIKTNFLTKLLNKFPGYNTKEESLLNLKGEVAFMIPDPNTLKSRIPSDNGEAVAYVDDFEGTKKLIPLGLSPRSWTISSIPIDRSISLNQTDPVIRDSLVSKSRSQISWFNFLNSVPISEVYPNRTIASNQSKTLSPMVINIRPDTVGPFNYINQTDFTALGPPKDKWSGIYKYLNTSQTNLIDENINYIEIWMQIKNFDGGKFVGDSARMYLDLGLMSEKIITSSLFPVDRTINEFITYHTEDRNLNGILQTDEDVGLDGYSSRSNIFPDTKELTLGSTLNLGSDPSRDNFGWANNPTSLNREDFRNFNGTEGNSGDFDGISGLHDGIIDTEDLNKNGTLDNNNSYFEYRIPLDSGSFSNHPFIVGSGTNGWYQIQVPLSKFKDSLNQATLTNIQYVRMWFKGFEQSSEIKIVDFNLVGSQWVKQNKIDSSYSISVVSIEENPNYYEPPVAGDILRQRDPSQTDQNVLSNEQSISLDLKNILPGQSRFIYKSFNTRPYDLINYKILKLFVNGDPSFRYTDENHYDAAMIVRLGSDSSNYYEYRAPIHPDFRPGTPWDSRNEIAITFSDLTVLKQLRDSLQTVVPPQRVPNGPPGAEYRIVGNPSIRSISQISMGVINNNEDPIFTQPISGSVWFNEMRVIKANDKSGYAFTLSAALKLADLATLNFTYNKTDPNFHNLEGRFGSLSLTNYWEFSGTVQAHKLLNALLSSLISVKLKNFFTIPFSFSHSESITKPNYLPGTDVEVETAVQSTFNRTGSEYLANNVRVASQTLTVQNRFSVNGMKFTFPGENFFVEQVLNKMEVSFYRNSISERSPTSESKYAWDAGGTFGLSSSLNLMNKLNINLGKFLSFGEFKDAKLYFFFPFIPIAPLFSNNIGIGTNISRQRGDEKLRTQLIANQTTRNFTANRNMTMDWKFIENWMVDLSGSYSFQSGSDLTFLETRGDSNRTQRPNSEILRDIFFDGGFIDFGKDLNYQQTVLINPRINIPILKNFIDITTSYRVNYAWATSQINSTLGNNVGYNSDFQTTGFVKLNKIFDIFKGSGTDKFKAGGYQQEQDPADLLKLIRSFIPEQVTVTYAQTKGLLNAGVRGRPGFGNFWMVFGAKENFGPSRLYQLGWIEDPGSRISEPNVVLRDQNNLASTINFSTLITPIFPDNLKINFTYKILNSKNLALSYTTDTLGNLGTPTSRQETKIITRPSFFVTTDIVEKLERPFGISSPTERGKIIADSFEKNIVSFPFPNWNLTLSGVEKFELFKNFAQTMSLEMGYAADYKKTIYDNGIDVPYIKQQNIISGFNPLFGLNVTFKQIAEGNLTAGVKVSKTNNLDLDPFNNQVNTTATNDFSINASFTKSGFKVPLFGLSLNNDLTISFSYTRTINDPVNYQYDPNADIYKKLPLFGTVSINLNPSIQYALSKSVTMQLFYKYTKTGPTEGNESSTATRKSNEAGLNIKLLIQ